MMALNDNMDRVCVVIPTLNSQTHLPILLSQLSGHPGRVVISDGGSEDETLVLAAAHKVVFTSGYKGRGSQLARGARWSGTSDWYLFLHCDCQLPQNWAQIVADHISNTSQTAGYFQFGADTAKWQGRLMEFIVGLRNIFWHLPYGDQGLLISKDMYSALGGFKDMPLFEDVDLIDRFKAKYGARALRRFKVQMMTDVSAYERDGFKARTGRNFRLWRAYKSGKDIKALAVHYTGDMSGSERI